MGLHSAIIFASSIFLHSPYTWTNIYFLNYSANTTLQLINVWLNFLSSLLNMLNVIISSNIKDLTGSLLISMSSNI